MKNIAIRTAKVEEANVVMNYIRNILDEMHQMGGHQISKSDEQWLEFSKSIKDAMEKGTVLYIFAEKTPEKTIVGFAEARIISMGFVYEPKKVLHISSVFVNKDNRRKGIATSLLDFLVAWGKENSCVEADLNTLLNNPAKKLFEKIGFNIYEHNLRMRL